MVPWLVFLEIQQMTFASPPWADLDGASSTDNHQDHFYTTFGTFRTTDQILVAVRAEKIHLGVDRDLMLGFKMITAIQGG